MLSIFTGWEEPLILKKSDTDRKAEFTRLEKLTHTYSKAGTSHYPMLLKSLDQLLAGSEASVALETIASLKRIFGLPHNEAVVQACKQLDWETQLYLHSFHARNKDPELPENVIEVLDEAKWAFPQNLSSLSSSAQTQSFRHWLCEVSCYMLDTAVHDPLLRLCRPLIRRKWELAERVWPWVCYDCILYRRNVNDVKSVFEANAQQLANFFNTLVQVSTGNAPNSNHQGSSSITSDNEVGKLTAKANFASQALPLVFATLEHIQAQQLTFFKLNADDEVRAGNAI